MSRRATRDEEDVTWSSLFSKEVPTPIEWLLLTGNRWLVAGSLLFVYLLVLLALFHTEVIAVTNADTLTRSFSALIGGNLTLITIVISINQLVLSREFSSPAELRSRIKEMVEYRQEVAEIVESGVTPVTPDGFLDFLATLLRERTIPLSDVIEGIDDAGLREDLDALTSSILAEADTMSRSLEAGSRGPFRTLVVVLDAKVARKMHDIRRVQTVHRESISDDLEETLDELVYILEYIGVGRQYLKSLYFQRELADLSRKLLYTGVVALGLLLISSWVYGAPGGPRLQGTALVVLAGTTAVVAFAPLAVFFAYVLRIATLTRRTASLVPFAIREDSSV